MVTAANGCFSDDAVFATGATKSWSSGDPAALLRGHGTPCLLWHPPVDPFKQHRQLRGRQAHLALLRPGSHETPALKTLVEKAGSLAVPPDDLQ